MNNNNETRGTWENALTIEGVDLGELYETLGVRDVLTTLNNTVNAQNNESVGIVELLGEQEPLERTQVSFSDLMGHREETTIDAGLTGTSEGMSLSEAMESRARNHHNRDTTEDVMEDTFREIDDIDDIDVVVGAEHTEDSIQRQETQTGANHPQQPHRNGQEDGGNSMERGNTISLSDLFARQTTLADLDNQGEVTLADIQETNRATTYTRPDLTEITDSEVPIVEFGEDVVEVLGGGYGSVTFDRHDYETFNHKSINERNEELERATQDRINSLNETEGMVKDIAQELFGNRFSELYGYDKIGRTREGIPYIKAVLATRFTKLNDRRFRKPYEMRRTSRNVAVANTYPSVKAFIEMTITKSPRGDILVKVVDAEGENLPYLEQKLAWLRSNGYQGNLLALYMKTQLDFEEQMTSIDQLKTIDFS